MWVIIPVKPLKRAKSRLASVLDPDEREAFSRQMLEHTFSVVKQVNAITDILVISRDSAALSFARKLGGQTVRESGSPELNDALTRATQVAMVRNAQGVLILASDIPLLQVSDLQGMLACSTSSPAVVIAPDRHHEGTNALLITPPGLIGYHYGPDSYTKHRQEAQNLQIPCYIFESPTLALDVDISDDLELYHSLRDKSPARVTLSPDSL
jgi:2-phospho-L-lactate guanylyltransferase